MKTTQALLLAATLSAGLLVATGANAALVASDGGQTVFDTDLGIYWLANANLAKTENFGVIGIDPSGSMQINQAREWIAAMNAVNYLGYNDWRLPETVSNIIVNGSSNETYSGHAYGYNSVVGELAHLFYNELSNKGHYNTAGENLYPNYGYVDDPANPNDESLFTNAMYQLWYSYGTETTALSSHWCFNLGEGLTAGCDSTALTYILPVRGNAADFTAYSAVPVPAAAWLLGSGLLGLIGVARRRLVIR